MSDRIVKPFIWTGGTARETLLAQRTEAADAMRAALQRLTAAEPHLRDYLTEEKYSRAKAVHLQRLAVVELVLAELELEALAIAEVV